MGIQAFCVHGHFYQPPREDPLTGKIPVEPGAAPYQNWNERIHEHCYRPNAELGNFGKISFNIGPTLMEWMASFDPATVRMIVAQDRKNLDAFGVGNAMAQPYNHTILPLASRLDKQTQIRWGITDFQARFGHAPIGMWLPETAVDEETLDVMAQNGIQYTILAPWQAEDPNIDITQPYKVSLPEGRTMTVFFYDQDLSTRVSFDPGSTMNADYFLLNAVLPRFASFNGTGSNQPHLLMVASDGELYGHHQQFRDQFLNRLMTSDMDDRGVRATYPGLWLRDFPAQKMTTIRSYSSWSCHHGVIRWMGPCSCTPQSDWKAPLRLAINELAKRMDEVFLETARQYFVDPWETRDRYIHVLLRQQTAEEIILESATKKIYPDEMRRLELLLRAQYDRQRMYTSCGWFFDDFDRIEPRNNVAYATQAIWNTFLATGIDLTEVAAAWLKPVRSRRSGMKANDVFSQHLQRAQQTTNLELPTPLAILRPESLN